MYPFLVYDALQLWEQLTDDSRNREFAMMFMDDINKLFKLWEQRWL